MSLLPKKARAMADPERYILKKFIVEAASEIPAGARVLDAGAGNCRYRPFFARQRYIAADFCRVEDKNYRRMELVTDLLSLGMKDGSLDAVLCIQVLEHVPEPAKLVREFQRVLKPGGTLYLSCPQNWGVHLAPYDFYRFTSYALWDIFGRTGFDVVYIKPKGGYFALIGKLFTRLPYIVKKPASGAVRKAIYRINFTILKEVFFYWVPFFLVLLDRLDKRRDFTLGYVCKAVKK